MIYTVTFNPAIDYVVRLDKALEVGEVNRAVGEDCVLGGKGINVSGVLRELGCESVALGFVAGETGAWLERGLAAQGLKTDFVHLENGMTRINVKIKAGQKFVFQMNEAEKAATRDLQNKNLAAALAQPCMLSRTAADALLFMVCFYWYSGNSRVRRRTRSLISSFFSS